MDSRIVTALIVVVGVPATLFGYIVVVERAPALPARSPQPRLRPWLWLLPALLLLGLFLVYPTIATVDPVAPGQEHRQPAVRRVDQLPVLLQHGRHARSPSRNNIIWLVLLTAFVVVGGLLSAILFDRVRYEPVAKSLLFVPLAISFVGAGVIWKFMYDYKPPAPPQIGTLNGAITAVGGPALDFLQTPPPNTISLDHRGGLDLDRVRHGHPVGCAQGHQRRAARGGPRRRRQRARRSSAASRLPLLMPTIAVVATTMIITALKAFDIVYVMTGGNYDTDVMANRMYKELFNFGQPGRASAVATILRPADHPGHGLQHPPVPGPGGDPMTARRHRRVRPPRPAVARS